MENKYTEETQQIFRDVFNDKSINISKQMTASDIPEWDSLAHINLILAIESKFSIKFALGEIQELQCVGHMLSLIESKLEK